MHVYANRGFLPRFLPDLNPLGTSFTRKRINFQFGEVVLKFFLELRQRSDLSSHIFNGQLRGFAKLMPEVDHQSSPGLLSRQAGKLSVGKAADLPRRRSERTFPGATCGWVCPKRSALRLVGRQFVQR